MDAEMRLTEDDMDWAPLAAVLPEASLGDWMWMHVGGSPETGADVHFYKHVWSRRYLRLDAEGRVYRENGVGEPAPLPSCGGASLAALVIMACGYVGEGMPGRLTFPVGQEPCKVEHMPVLATLLQAVVDDLLDICEQVSSRSEPAASDHHACGS